MDKKIAHTKAGQNTQTHHNDNSAESQRHRLVAWLKANGSNTTLEARHHLDILAPAPRVFELRGMHYPIDTIWVHGYTDAGHMHRIAKYVLRGANHE